MSGNKDYKIYTKYIQKSNIVLAANYFTFVLMLSSAGVAFFFLNGNILLYSIGAILVVFYLLLYKNRNNSIITSVTVYKYSDVFLEILKSFKISKHHISSFKNFISKNKK